jgi:hypothetical protein
MVGTNLFHHFLLLSLRSTSLSPTASISVLAHRLSLHLTLYVSLSVLRVCVCDKGQKKRDEGERRKNGGGVREKGREKKKKREERE